MTELATLNAKRQQLMKHEWDHEHWFVSDNECLDGCDIDELRNSTADIIAKTKEDIPKMYANLPRNLKADDVIIRLKKRLLSLVSSSDDVELINHIEALLQNE